MNKLMELAEHRCCEHQSLRTIYRGPLGCVEECKRCGFAFGYDENGELTPTCAAALRARASTGEIRSE